MLDVYFQELEVKPSEASKTTSDFEQCCRPNGKFASTLTKFTLIYEDYGFEFGTGSAGST